MVKTSPVADISSLDHQQMHNGLQQPSDVTEPQQKMPRTLESFFTVT